MTQGHPRTDTDSSWPFGATLRTKLAQPRQKHLPCRLTCDACMSRDKRSQNNDYVGMLKAGSQATYEDGLEYLQKLYDSFEDVNYHSENKHLGFAIEEMENLGLIECDDEDFALCSFACPSKTDVGGVIRKGLGMLQAEV